MCLLKAIKRPVTGNGCCVRESEVCPESASRGSADREAKVQAIYSGRSWSSPCDALWCLYGTATCPSCCGDPHGRCAQRTVGNNFRDPSCVYMMCFHKISPFHSILGGIPLFAQGHRASHLLSCVTPTAWLCLGGQLGPMEAHPTPSITPAWPVFPSRAGGGSAVKRMLTCSGSDFIG